MSNWPGPKPKSSFKLPVLFWIGMGLGIVLLGGGAILIVLSRTLTFADPREALVYYAKGITAIGFGIADCTLCFLFAWHKKKHPGKPMFFLPTLPHSYPELLIWVAGAATLFAFRTQILEYFTFGKEGPKDAFNVLVFGSFVMPFFWLGKARPQDRALRCIVIVTALAFGTGMLALLHTMAQLTRGNFLDLCDFRVAIGLMWLGTTIALWRKLNLLRKSQDEKKNQPAKTN